jgi:hypothetical protein
MTIRPRQVRRAIRRWLRCREPDAHVWHIDGKIVARMSSTRDQLLITLMEEDGGDDH